MSNIDARTRCDWAKSSAAMVEYHDCEWGVPLHDDRKLFEYLVLDAFQAGLSWAIVLNKREALREAFHGFDAPRVAAMSAEDVELLLQMPGIIRNRAKILATIENAGRVESVVDEFGSLDSYLWSFVDGKPLCNAWTSVGQIPAQTKESQMLSADLKRRGFRFVGPTIVYAVMQSAGLVNDHVVDCFRYGELAQ